MLAKEDVPLDTTEPLPSVASKKKKNKKKKSAAAKNAATESLVPLAIDHCGKKFSPFPYPTPCDDVLYVDYTDESWLDDIRVLVAKDLSEPYSIFTYRYFLHNWPKLCVCVFAKTETGERGEMIGTLLCKAEQEYKCYRGYIAMLTVNDTYRGKGIGQKLAMIGIDRMVEMGCEEIVLETELSNKGALRLYDKLGFTRDEFLSRYYLNGEDAYRLKLWIDNPKTPETAETADTDVVKEATPAPL